MIVVGIALGALILGFGFGILWESGFIIRGLRGFGPAFARACEFDIVKWWKRGQRRCQHVPSNVTGGVPCGKRLDRKNPGPFCFNCKIQRDLNEAMDKLRVSHKQEEQIKREQQRAEIKEQERERQRTGFRRIQVDGPKQEGQPVEVPSS